MKKINKIIALVLCISMLVSSFLIYTDAAEFDKDPSLVATYSVEKGVMTTKVKLMNNFKGLNNLVFEFGYDPEELELVSIENGEIFNEENNGSLFDVNTENNPLVLYFEENGVANIKKVSGILVTLKFNVLQDKDFFDITLRVDPDNTFSCAEGSVTPVDAEFYMAEVEVPGDLNGDGDVNVVDSAILTELLLEEHYTSLRQEASADLNDDGTLNAIDANMMIGLMLRG